MPLEVTIATANPAKAAHLRDLCEGLDVRFSNSSKQQLRTEENASTHLGNAIAKAVACSRYAEGAALASDGGLVIPCLGDLWESTLTHRATGGNITDSERARRLLARMRHLLLQQRNAYWAEAIAIARDGILVCAWETDGMQGQIGNAFRADPYGANGFWADGLWETYSGKKRWELSTMERASLSDPWVQLFPVVNGFLARMI